MLININTLIILNLLHLYKQNLNVNMCSRNFYISETLLTQSLPFVKSFVHMLHKIMKTP